MCQIITGDKIYILNISIVIYGEWLIHIIMKILYNLPIWTALEQKVYIAKLIHH